jgi:two-component system nitrate/nitrite response regulator NarL
MTEKIRVMLVDDHSLCRSGLKELLEHRGGMTVVTATGDPQQVVPLIREHDPQLLVLDLRLAQTDGLSVLRMIRADGCDVPVVILTTSLEEQDLVNGYRSGANSYVRKPVDFKRFVEAVKHLGL